MRKDECNLSGGLREFERLLAAVTPVEPGLGRDRLMFEAGRHWGRRRLRRWRVLSGVLAAGLGLALLVEPPAGPVRSSEIWKTVADSGGRMGDLPAPRFADAGPPNRAAYLHLRRRVLKEGLNALPASRTMPPTFWQPPRSSGRDSVEPTSRKGEPA